MTRYQLSQISTMKQVRLVLNRFSAIWTSFAGFAGQVKTLGAKIELILVLAQEQERDNRGLRADKVKLTDLLTDAVMAVAGPLGAWALVAQREAIRLQVDLVPSTVRKLAAERLVLVAKDVLALGQKHLAEAGDYALTAGELEVLVSRIVAFEQLVASPREGVARTAALTKLIEAEIDQTMDLLKLFFDRVMFRFKESHAEFYLNYQTARKVVQPSYRTEQGAEAARIKREEKKTADEEAAAVKKAAKGEGGAKPTEVEAADSEAVTASGAGAEAEEATAEEVAAVIGTMAEAQEEESVRAGVLQVNGTELAG